MTTETRKYRAELGPDTGGFHRQTVTYETETHRLVIVTNGLQEAKQLVGLINLARDVYIRDIQKKA